MTTLARSVTGGVDTHLDVHVAAALDEKGTLLGVEYFETTRAGYKKLLAWFENFGPVVLVGVEGTSSYGAGLTRHLHAEGVAVVEVTGPIAGAAGARASPIPKTPSRPPGPPSAVMRLARPRPRTETSRPSG